MSATAILLVMLQALTLGATNVAIDAAMAAPVGPPSWSDEFDEKTIDLSKWRFDTNRNKAGWFNHEKQYYANARAENTRVEDGHLVIEARRETLSLQRYPDWGGQAYTSGKLIGKWQGQYGFYEIRAKLPCSRGTWPAIWMLPDRGPWPDQGEIDIVEMVGHEPHVVHATLHTGLFNHTNGTQRGAQATVPTSCTDFHRYQLN